MKQETESDCNESAHQTEQIPAWAHPFNSTENPCKKDNSLKRVKFFVQDHGSDLSEAASLGSEMAFNPFCGRGKLLTHLAQKSKVMNKCDVLFNN